VSPMRPKATVVAIRANARRPARALKLEKKFWIWLRRVAGRRDRRKAVRSTFRPDFRASC
jgi:hypothetical protein